MKATQITTGTNHEDTITSIYRMRNGGLVKVQTDRVSTPDGDWGEGAVAELFDGKKWKRILDSTAYESKVTIDEESHPTDEQWIEFQKAREVEMIEMVEKIFTEL